MEARVKKMLCLIMLYSILLGVSGCSGKYHLSEHCNGFTEDRIVDPMNREDYRPILTPMTDLLVECYCYTEDLVTGAVYFVGTGISNGMTGQRCE
jgi:hypothetical protein